MNLRLMFFAYLAVSLDAKSLIPVEIRYFGIPNLKTIWRSCEPLIWCPMDDQDHSYFLGILLCKGELGSFFLLYHEASLCAAVLLSVYIRSLMLRSSIRLYFSSFTDSQSVSSCLDCVENNHTPIHRKMTILGSRHIVSMRKRKITSSTASIRERHNPSKWSPLLLIFAALIAYVFSFYNLQGAFMLDGIPDCLPDTHAICYIWYQDLQGFSRYVDAHNFNF